ncbi:hypothetical protein AAFF_G00184910 [Aldrovandia affinis]|uniref:Uncharacterized protein n=1 Tax=Aldrovandia affinis TaxID=143900 RepID=A0AAD7RKG1_9TELE|nr:hypothetical protein AAFF_G00184910 [Aldrovandia affinis]
MRSWTFRWESDEAAATQFLSLFSGGEGAGGREGERKKRGLRSAGHGAPLRSSSRAGRSAASQMSKQGGDDVNAAPRRALVGASAVAVSQSARVCGVRETGANRQRAALAERIFDGAHERQRKPRAFLLKLIYRTYRHLGLHRR